MVLGALIDAGVPLEDVRRALGSLAIVPAHGLDRAGHARRASRPRSSACSGEDGPLDHAHASHGHDHGHDHGHQHHGHSHVHTEPHEEKHHHVHRTLAEINRLIDGSALSQTGKERAKELFPGSARPRRRFTARRWTRCTCTRSAHSIRSSTSSATVYALETLRRRAHRGVAVERGQRHGPHGAWRVSGARAGDATAAEGRADLCGPAAGRDGDADGRAAGHGLRQEFGAVPPMRVAQIGYGAGNRDFADTPNVLRVLIGEADATAPIHTVVVIEAEIDDMNPQIFGVLMDRLLAQGALDVFYTPIQMKKNRPGTLLSVIATPDARERADRYDLPRDDDDRRALSRDDPRVPRPRTVTVTTSVGDVRVKVARRNGEILNAAPEFDDCVRLAGEHNVPAKNVQALAMKAWLDAGNRGL